MTPQAYAANFSDSFHLQKSTRYYTSEGFLRALAVATRTGTQYYPSDYLGLPGPSRMVGLYRPPEAVFHDDTKSSLQGKAVTRGHPDGRASVTPDNWRELAIGHAGDHLVELDDGRLAVTITFTHPDAIRDVENGIDEISMGSRSSFSPFMAEDGTAYDYYYVDSSIDINHLALIEPGQGRAGRDVRVMDSREENMENTESSTPENRQDESAVQREQPAVQLHRQPREKEKSALPQPALPNIGDTLVWNGATWVKQEETALQNKKQEETALQNKKQEETAVAADSTEEDRPLIEDAAFASAVQARSQLIADSQPFLPPEMQARAHTLTDRQILIAAVQDVTEDAERMTDDYLRGALAMKTAHAAQLQDSWQGAGNAAADPFTGSLFADATDILIHDAEIAGRNENS